MIKVRNFRLSSYFCYLYINLTLVNHEHFSMGHYKGRRFDACFTPIISEHRLSSWFWAWVWVHLHKLPEVRTSALKDPNLISHLFQFSHISMMTTPSGPCIPKQSTNITFTLNGFNTKWSVQNNTAYKQILLFVWFFTGLLKRSDNSGAFHLFELS
jgi:hypothetical protein